MHEVLARWMASLMLSLLIGTLDPRPRESSEFAIVAIARTVLVSILLGALRRAF